MKNTEANYSNSKNESFHESLLIELARKADQSHSQVIDPELGVIDSDRRSDWDHASHFFGDSSLEASFRVHGFFHPR